MVSAHRQTRHDGESRAGDELSAAREGLGLGTDFHRAIEERPDSASASRRKGSS